MSETELKFTISDQTAAELRARLMQLAPADQPPSATRLHSVYFDTKKHRLKQAGVALRLRRDGDAWVQTVKAKASRHAGLQICDEAETQVPDGDLHLNQIPDKALRKSVRALVKGKTLRPVCETAIDRLALVLHGAGSEVEIALDQGRIIAGDRAAPFQELELELKSGSLSALYDLAAVLLPGGGLDLSQLSKSERGYLLAATGHIDLDLAPRRATTVALAPEMTTSAAAAAILADCAHQILVNLMVVRRSTDPEGPHQLRIGLRRLRAAFATFKALFKDPEAQHLLAEAKWLGQMVGRQRDLDVAQTDLLQPDAARAPENTGLAALVSLVHDRGTRNRTILRDILETTRVQTFALELACFVQTRAWDAVAPGSVCARPVSRTMVKALNKAWAKAEARAAKIETLDHEARHELRKALKSLRYQIEFAAPLWKPKAVAKQLSRLKALQQIFGDLNDLAMLESLFAEDDDRPETQDAHAALDRMLGTRHAAADADWAKAQTLWADLARTPAFWR